MNRYPLWKYVVIAIALLIGVLYTLPNFFGEDPAVQVSSAKTGVRVDASTQSRIAQALAQAGIKPLSVLLDGNSVKVRLDNTDIQLKAKDVIQRALDPDANDAGYVVALWSLDSQDYTDKDPASLAERCGPKHVRPGDVILFHEGQEWTLEALPRIVTGLQASGLECVTMYDLFAR